MTKPLFVHPEAKAESQAAYDWYFARSPAVAERFRQELAAAYTKIDADPERFAAYPHGPGQYLQLNRFPYVVIFLGQDDHVAIFAIAHTSRKPGYWAERNDGNSPG